MRKILALLFLLLSAPAFAAVNANYSPPQYTGNGSATQFAFPYPYFEASDLSVVLFNTSTNQVVTPAPVLNGGNTYDFTIAGVLGYSYPSSNIAEFASATITFNNAPPGNYQITIVRAVPATQTVNFIDNSKLTTETLNSELDKLTLLVQQLGTQVAASYQNPATDPAGLNLIAPPAAVRASQYAGWDSSGNFTALAGPSGSGSAPVSTAMAPVVDASTTALAASLLSPRLGDIAGIGWVQGDLLYFNGTNLVRLGAGTAGQALTTQGAGANPTFAGAPSIVGHDRNMVGTTPTTTTLKYTADEIDVEDALGGTPSKISIPSSGSGLTLTASTTGAGGMDTGSQPTSGFLSVYLITKPGGASPALLGTVTGQGSIYSGGHMPSGYTQSALIGLWPCTTGPAFVAGTQLDREFAYAAPSAVFTGTNSATSLTSASISGQVPAAAKTVSGVLGFTAGHSGSNYNVAIAASSGGLGMQQSDLNAPNTALNGYNGAFSFRALQLVGGAVVYWEADTASLAMGLSVTAYSF